MIEAFQEKIKIMESSKIKMTAVCTDLSLINLAELNSIIYNDNMKTNGFRDNAIRWFSGTPRNVLKSVF